MNATVPERKDAAAMRRDIQKQLDDLLAAGLPADSHQAKMLRMIANAPSVRYVKRKLWLSKKLTVIAKFVLDHGPKNRKWPIACWRIIFDTARRVAE
jgi:hypothetical protein